MKNYIFTVIWILILSQMTHASEFKVTSMNLVTYGSNAYAPSIARLPESTDSGLWFGGQVGSGQEIKDSIYYLRRPDNLRNFWQSPLASTPVLEPNNRFLISRMRSSIREQIRAGETPLNIDCLTDETRCITHINDPTVTIHRNRINNRNQYTMFFTVCPWPCIETPTFNQAEIWSMVSADGIHWGFPVILLRGTNLGPAEPSAIFEADGRSFWKVYYINRLQPQQVQVALVGGNRRVLQTKTAYHWKNFGYISSVEVKKIGNSYSMFFNHLNGLVMEDPGLGTQYPYAHAYDVYKVDSESSTQWTSGNELPLVKTDPSKGICGLITPAVEVIENNPNKFDLYFAIIQTRIGASGLAYCDLMGSVIAGTPQWIGNWTFEK